MKTKSKDSQIQLNNSVNCFISMGVLDSRYFDFPFPLEKIRGKKSSGASSPQWRVFCDQQSNKLSFRLVIEAYFSLLTAFFFIKTKRLHFLINKIKYKASNKNILFFEPKKSDLKNLVAALNRAWLFFPVKTACLEWSTTLLIMAIRRKWMCNLNIGVQTFPFVAHAWLDVNGKIVEDSPEFPDKLSIIFSEPFDRCFE